jgi:L,D-transpeptidase YcbB
MEGPTSGMSDKQRQTNGSERNARSVMTRRGALGRIALGVLASSSAASGALAQDNWFERVFGTNVGARAATSPEDRKKPEILNDLRPDSTPWRSEAMIEAMEGAIQRYQQIADKGGWPLIPGARMIRPEDDDERIPVLRRRLAVSGELGRANATSNSFSFDGELELAVRRYQENNGLRVSGRVDKPTLASLNVPAQVRVQQLKLNLQRVRDLLQTRPEDRYVLVNAAAFQLEAVERGEVQQRHRVIAGRTERQSPVVRANIRAVNFFPYWRVPDSVATLDIIPRLRKEPEYLTKEKIRVVRGNFNGPEVDPSTIDWNTATSAEFKFRQDPGPHNALGLMRIDMPNSEGVYMHDTPMKQLFQQRGRAFSAGCVRVQDVPKLVDWIARYEVGWDQPGRADAVTEAGNALDVNLTRQIPVYFTYITAWAEPKDGRVVFRPDIYGRDGLRDATAGRERDESEGPAPPPSLAP